MTEQPTCAERIEAHRASRDADVAALLAASLSDGPSTIDGEELSAEDAWERLQELPLSVDIVKSLKVLLSTGGPADWLEIPYDEDGIAGPVVYHFADWWDHAAVPVDDTSGLYRWAEQLAEHQADLDHVNRADR